MQIAIECVMVLRCITGTATSQVPSKWVCKLCMWTYLLKSMFKCRFGLCERMRSLCCKSISVAAAATTTNMLFSSTLCCCSFPSILFVCTVFIWLLVERTGVQYLLNHITCLHCIALLSIRISCIPFFHFSPIYRNRLLRELCKNRTNFASRQKGM